MLPILPFICFGSVIAGVLGISWYDTLDKEKKAEADMMARRLALSVYSMTLDQLTHLQAKTIYSLVQRALGG